MGQSGLSVAPVILGAKVFGWIAVVAVFQSSLLWDKDCGRFTIVEDCGEFTVLTRVNCHVVDQSHIAHFFAHLINAHFIPIKTKAYFRHKS
jgi:hypothetical protein